jgi:hypothetical protein
MKIGEKLPQDYVDFIRRNTSPKERSEICDKVGMTTSILNYVLARDRNLTEETLKLVKAVLTKAKKNFKNTSQLLNSI